ncbi:MAG: accessory gene regulator B family protein [Lachnospiraceae bacterium]|nr:accessory gene regulator B family protein [Lachnospiraceae bacterium]
MSYFEAIGLKLIEKELIEQDEKEIYIFGLQQGFYFVLNIITAITIGIFMGKAREIIIYILMFIPLRMFAGGYHANSYCSCYIISSVITFFTLKMTTIMEHSFYWLSIGSVSILIIWLLSPIEDKNKPLEKEENKKYQKITRSILLFEITVAVAMWMLKFYNAYFTIVSIFVVLALLLIVGWCKNQNMKV